MTIQMFVPQYASGPSESKSENNLKCMEPPLLNKSESFNSTRIPTFDEEAEDLLENRSTTMGA